MGSKNSGFRLGAVIACVVAMFCIGIVYLWSVFQQPVIDHYGWPKESVTMISSAIVFFYMVGTLIGGVLNDRIGPRLVVIIGGVIFCAGLFTTSLLRGALSWPIYITYGVVAGVGVGFVYSAALNCIQRWFPHRRGFATGISVCSFGLSTVVLGPLIVVLIRRLGVPVTFRTLAFTFPVLAIVCGFFISTPSQEYINSLAVQKKAAIVQRQYTVGEALRTMEWWSVALALFFLPAPYMMILPIVKTLGVTRDLTEAATTVVVSAMGVVSAVSRLVSPTLSDKTGRARTIWVLSLVCLIASLLMTFARGPLYIIAVLLITFGYSGPSGIFAAMTTDAFGTKHVGAIFGIALMFLGVSSPVFTFISTRVSTSTAFVIAAVSSLASLAVLPLYNVGRKKHRERDLEIAKQQAAQG